MRAKLVLFSLVMGCSNGGDKNDGGGMDGGGGDGIAGGITQKGVITDRTSKQPEPGATVTVLGGASSAMTDMNGAYALSVPKDTPYTFFVTGDNHFKVIEQELIASDSFDRGSTTHPSNTDGNLLKSILMGQGFDPKLATFTVGLYKTGSCASVDGALIDVDPPQAAAKVMYFSGGIPSTAMYQPWAKEGELPAAILYNVDPKAAVKVKVTWASADGGMVGAPCTQVPYPVQDPTTPSIKYTGNLVIDVGDVTSYERVYLK
jgi:hypothetical protein